MSEAERTGLDHVVLPRRRPGLALLERHRPSPADNVLDAELAAFAAAGDTVLDAWLMAGDDRMVTDVWSAGRHIVQRGRHVRRDEVERAYRAAARGLRDAL